MTRFNHNGKTYECNTSDLMDISLEVGSVGSGSGDKPNDDGDKPNDDGDKPDEGEDEGILINNMEAFLRSAHILYDILM